MANECARQKAVGFTVAGLVCSLGLVASAQTASKLPPTPPTAMTPPASISSPVPMTPTVTAPAAPAETAPRFKARVTYISGLLEVHADNSSLNQILRDISRQTGMKIVGGVAEQRVFGSYGPAPAATVLQTLLEGTGTNVLLQEDAAHAPEQLSLTPRAGGAAPPPPSSPSYSATDAEPELPLPGPAQPETQSKTTVAPTTATTAPNAQVTPSTPASRTLPANDVAGSPNIPPTVSTAPLTNSVPSNSLPTPPQGNNPNMAPTAKTPEQIYEELKQLQQKKANPQANAQGSTAPK